ncbi:hypothetical protein AAAW50_003908 [Cronobacter sakazakii]|nr:hypothetical protein [Cronobacter sakazakii]ELY6004906.1 hypothetical protein [Cronobacter sakazakii]EMC4305468.1 hypothetical protein [Cronobacter sakazakii]HEO1583523.1 hypothetical protein [Cronobacter sakazakii]HEO1587684.1 hypothetical protein [Cronobacter sakazakii]
MVYVITTEEVNEATGKPELITSHGIDRNTGKQVILPPEHPQDIGAEFCTELQSWVILQK